MSWAQLSVMRWRVSVSWAQKLQELGQTRSRYFFTRHTSISNQSQLNRYSNISEFLRIQCWGVRNGFGGPNERNVSEQSRKGERSWVIDILRWEKLTVININRVKGAIEINNSSAEIRINGVNYLVLFIPVNNWGVPTWWSVKRHLPDQLVPDNTVGTSYQGNASPT